MQEKQKVTLYIPPQLHRQLKVKAAIEAEPMSALAERALSFYLNHSEAVERMESYGHTHQLYACPECDSSLVLRQGELIALEKRPNVLSDDSMSVEEELSVSKVLGDNYIHRPEGEEELVVC